MATAPIDLPSSAATLVDVLCYRAQHQQDKQIFTFQGHSATAEARLTAGELDHQARMIGSQLQHMGLAGQRALLLYPPGLDYIAAFFGCLYANVVAVPAYLPPSNRPAPRLRAIIEDAQPALALTTSATLANLRLQFEHTPQLGALTWLTTDDLTPSAEDRWQPPSITSATLAFLQYTSGSTATPKGVMLTHGTLLHNLGQIYRYFGHSAESRGVIWLPPYHDMGLIGGILQPLYGGFPVTLMSPVAFLQRPLRWLETIAQTGGTTSGGPNFAYDLCVRKSSPEQRAALDLSSWTVAFSGAEPIRPATIERFAEAFACAGFRREAFYPCYGLAEATLIVTGGQVAAPPTLRGFDREALAQNRVAAATNAESQELVGCGAPLGAFDQQIAIVQPGFGLPCAPDEIGEIWVAGPSVAAGYWNRADETAHAFAAYLAGTEEGPFLRTGDLGFVHDGELFITGRLKDLIIIHGRNYYPHDLEAAAEQSHIALQPNASAAFSIELGGEERLVIVHEVQRQHRNVSSSEVAAAVRRTIAEHHEVQVYAVVLIKPGALPRTSSGKIQRHVCRSQFLAGSLPVLGTSTLEAPEQRHEPDQIQLPPPATLATLDSPECERLVEQYLISRVAALLGVASEIVDREQPPSAFGLDSLAAVEIQHAVENDLGLIVPLTIFFETPSIAALAQTLTTQVRAATADDIEQPGDRPTVETSYPLSYGQRALWFLQQVAPENPAYTIARAMQIGADTFDGAALRDAFQALVDRHPALRTTFYQHLGAPRQQVQPEMQVAFHEIDATTWSLAALEARLTRESRQPFDLTSGPLLRVYLFRRDPGASILLLTVHHSIADGWSLALLLRELELLYSALAAGQPAPLKPTTGEYADYVRWQADLLAGPRGETLWRYWQQQLLGLSSGAAGATLPALELPLDHPRPPLQTYHGATERFQIQADLAQQLKALAAAESATLFTVLLAAFQTLLYRYTGQPAIVVGSPVAGRSRARFAETVGYFVNPLVLRADLAADLPFVDLLRQVRQTVLNALAHHEYPFPLLVERLSPNRDLSRSPLVQVMFALEQQAWVDLDTAGPALRLKPIEVEQQAVQFELELTLQERRGAFDGALRYNADLFEAATIARLTRHYQTLLQAIVANPAQRLGRLDLLTDAEYSMLAGWNTRVIDYRHDACLHQIVEAQVDRAPDAIAISTKDGSLTYAELDRQANQLARHLRALGVGPESLIAICMERTPALIVGLLAILKAGGAYLPLDPAYPLERLQFMLDDAQAAVLLTQRQLNLHLAKDRSDCQVICLDDDWSEIEQQSQERLAGTTSAQNLAYVIYTSGSTGTPKGVQIAHQGLCNVVAAQRALFGVESGKRVLQFSSISFDASIFEIVMALCAGATLYLASRNDLLPGEPLLEFLENNAISHITVPPSVLAALPNVDLPALEVIVSAGEACSPALVERWAVQRRFFNAYGPTEATIWSTIAQCYPGSHMVTIGQPIANTQIYILDPQLQPAPIGVAGEIFIGGDGLARGYLNRPDLTAERFIPDPFSQKPGSRLYKTGDLARYRADGQIEFLGRIDQQVKLRGFRIEPGEIEALLRQHAAVGEAVVLVREDRPGDQRLVAYVVKNQEPRTKNQEQTNKRTNEQKGVTDSPSSIELRQQLGSRLPDHMIPSAFVFLDALPLTPNGKLDRAALPTPEDSRRDPVTPSALPRSRIERSIAAVWQEVLGIARVGIHDSFFDLGGHSLLVAQVHSRLRETLNVDLALLDLFRYPTISSLAAHLAAEDVAAESGLAYAQETGDRLAAPEIALIGMDGRFPGAANLDEFWHNLRDGVEAITFFSDDELLAAGVPEAELRHPNYVKARGILRDIDQFDAEFFGVSPREAQITDPQQRLFLECAWNALEGAGYDSLRYAGRIGVFAGAGFNTYLLAADRAALESAGRYQALIGNDKDFLPTRVSYKLNLRGPSVTVQTACSSSLVAVHLACQSLLLGESDMAIAGGVTVGVPHKTGYIYEAGSMASPDGHCRAFDAAAQGMVFSSGVGVVVLKRLADALRDGDTIHAVIRGSAINNDGAGKIGYTAPSIEGQAEVIAGALKAARVDPASVGYVEAHGTGTALGDPIEAAALNAVFQPHIQQRGSVALGSVKTNIGHPDAAAGVAGLIKTVLALKHRQIPPSINFASPNPQINFAHSPFYVNTILRDWTSGNTPRRAGVSSFGIGGTNAHVIVEEAPRQESDPATRPWHLLVLSARSSAALDRATERLAAHLRQNPECDLADVAYTLQIGRRVFEHRRVLVCWDHADAIAALETNDPQRVLTDFSTTTDRPVAMMFPGQGAQYVGMGRELYKSEPLFRQIVDRCCDLLQPHLELDLRSILHAESDSEAAAQLEQTAFAQPALFVIEYALAQLWISWGIKPQAMIGHSIGEYVAACLAGVLSLEDALKLVAARGRLMQDVQPGAMVSVALPEQEILPLLHSESVRQLSLAAVNSDQLCVVSGPHAAIDALTRQLDAQEIEWRRLRTSHAFHSAMLEPIVERFADEVCRVTLHPPQIPYISNVSGTWITAADAQSPAYWATHLRQTVRFGAGLQVLLAEGDWLLLEVGPGRALSTLARQNGAGDSPHAVVASLPSRDDSDSQAGILSALGRCWLAGASIDWTRLYAEERRRIPLPTYPFERQRHWIETSAQAPRSPVLAGKQPDPADWFSIPFWKPSILLSAAQPESLPQRWLVFADGSRLSEQIIRALNDLGANVTTVFAGPEFSDSQPQSYTISPERAADYERLIRSLAAREDLPERIVYLWSLTTGQPGSERGAQFADAQRLGYAGLLNLARALGPQIAQPAHLAVIASQSASLMPNEPIAPENAPILGACAAIPQEYASLSCQVIDVDSWSNTRQAATLTKCLIGELLAAPTNQRIAYRSGQRWLQTFEPARIEAPAVQPSKLRDRGIYLIAGGLSPIDWILATYLARTVRARLVLTGPHALPERESWAAWLQMHNPEDALSRQIRQIQTLEDLGAEVLVVRADSGDAERMRKAIETGIERFGALHGVFYTATAAWTRHWIQQFDAEAYLSLFEPQAAGVAQVMELLGAQDLDLAMIVTANSGLLGGKGLAAAGATTRFIEALAHEQQRNNGCAWMMVSLDVEQIQLDPALADDAVGLTLEEALEIFHRALATESVSRLIVSAVDLPTRLRQATQQENPNEPMPPTRAGIARSSGRPYVAPRTPVEETLASIWQQLLGIEPIGIHDDFYELGGHSLLATQIIAQVQERLALRLSVQQLFASPTIALLAEAIDQQMAGAQSDQPAKNEAPGEAPIAAAPREQYRMKRAALNRQSSRHKSDDQQ